MIPTKSHRCGIGRIGRGLWLSLSFVVGAPLAAEAVEPLVPLPNPEYSFALTSVSVNSGIVSAGDVLAVDHPYPAVVIPRTLLGLNYLEDDLDALSSANTGVDSDGTFVLLFSVDEDTVGLAEPDAELIARNVPYNVFDQAVRGQATGDQFMSTILFDFAGIVEATIQNNVLVRNNFDEGGTDFSAQPPTSAHDITGVDSVDVVDATGRLPRVFGVVADVYYSVASESPSLDDLPTWNVPSAADVYYNADPPGYAPVELYAAYEQMHLVQDDDIDAAIIFDTNGNAQFDGTDVVLFSLAPGSPSLTTIPDASADGAGADVFVVRAGEWPALFVSAADLGLGAPQDNIDALDFSVCDDPLDCAARHGIRSPRGDLDGDSCIDVADHMLFAGCLFGPGGGLGVECAPGDVDGDDDVDLADFAWFARQFRGS